MKRFVFLTLIFIFVFCNVSLAGNNTYNLPLLPDVDYHYYIMFKDSDSHFELYFFSSLPGQATSYDCDNCHHEILDRAHKFTYDTPNDHWADGGEATPFLYCSNVNHWNGDYYNRQIIFSNFDVKDSNGNVIFGNSPLIVTPGESADDSPTLSGIGNFFNSLFDKLSNWFNSVIDYIKNIPSSIAYLFNNLGSLISNLLNDTINYIKVIPQSVVDLFKTLFQFLFVPSDNLFNDFKTMIEDKFGIFSQLKEIVLDSTTLDTTDSAPEFSITYAGHTLNIIDFSMFSQYRTFIHNIIILISSFFFIQWLIVSAPSIVMGQSVVEESGSK